MIDKVLPIWKPKNISSYDIIRKLKSIYGQIKVGHCGTLDPFAEGIVIICIGKYTKMTENFMNYDKSYIAEISLGNETDTLDNTGQIIKISNKKLKLNKNIIINVLNKYKGEIQQIPPYFSAKKICGVKMYNLARKDIFIRTKPFKVTINTIDLIKFNSKSINIKINCNKGTYIRSLARDICYDLGTCGYLSKLERYSVGSFKKENSISYNNLESCL